MKARPLPVPGFRFSGISCGIKAQGSLDLGLVLAESSCSAAAVFTQNLVQAAPVALSKQAIASGQARALMINSGNANACTGQQGLEDAIASRAFLADQLGCAPELIQIASTGVIGVPLALANLIQGIEPAIQAARSDQIAANLFGDAICTTDRFPKGASRQIDGYTLSVFAKGAGMIAPNMATMLAYALTDAPIDSGDLDRLWRHCMSQSFNAVMVDGDTSTNDTAVILASGQGAPLKGAALNRFALALAEVCQEAAVQLVEDGEGARCVVELNVVGAPDDRQARHVAKTIALSPLCKTAFFGADPNWGRIIAAAGRSGVDFDPDQLTLTLGDADQSMMLFAQGMPLTFDKTQAEVMMRGKRFRFDLDLKSGTGQSHVWTCDLGHNYVTLNAEYTT